MKQELPARSRASGGATRPGRPPASATARASSLREAACEAIKHRITPCVSRPGESINELQLWALLKIGRTPVPQALDRLMRGGRVEVIPRKGVIVKPVSLHEVLQIIEVRLINEP